MYLLGSSVLTIVMKHNISETPPPLGKERITNISPSKFDLDHQTEQSLIEEIWEDVDGCLRDFPKTNSDCESDDDIESYAQTRSSPIIAKMPCGDFHVCQLGKPCPFLFPNEDRLMVCLYTGIEHGPEVTTEMFDLNGGSDKKSGDPDQTCGNLIYGKWNKRVDPGKASKLAFEMASRISDSDLVQCSTNQYIRPVHDKIKRGALCVGEENDKTGVKRQRNGCKKQVTDNDTRCQLQSEAVVVITKLIDHKRSSTFKRASPIGKLDRKCAPVDPRMCDHKFVFNKSLRRYLKNCSMALKAPSLDTIHNIALMAQEASKSAQKYQDNKSASDSIRSAKFRNLCASLVVSLWSAACSSPYMSNAKRGTDAYRPFICGVLYGFKRGVTLDDGTVLIPTCPQLAQALPVLRGTGGNTTAKTLHSSSHRGLCTLSRCIASVPKVKQESVFRSTARIAQQFSKQTFTRADI